MLQLNLSFRKLLLRNIAQLKSEDLDRYENLLALRSELIHQLALSRQVIVRPEHEEETIDQCLTAMKTAQTKAGSESLLKPTRPLPNVSYTTVKVDQDKIEDQIKQITAEANEVIEPFRDRFEALHAIWISRRKLAVSQGNLLQIPTTVEGYKNLFIAVLDYRVGQIKNFAVVLRGRVADFFSFLADNAKTILWTVIILVLLGSLVLLLMPKTQERKPIQKMQKTEQVTPSESEKITPNPSLVRRGQGGGQ